jgi:hypothetical protein
VTDVLVDHTLTRILAQGRWQTWERHIRTFARVLNVSPAVVLAMHLKRTMARYIPSERELLEAPSPFDEALEWAASLDDHTELPWFEEAVDNLRRAADLAPWFIANGRIQ